MKLWMPLLAVVPAGLAIGLLGAHLVDSDSPREPVRPPGAEAEAADPQFYPAPADKAQPGRAGGDAGRPAFDWDEEYWPGDHGGVSAGAYDYDEDYFGPGEPAFGRPAEPDGGPPPPARRGEAAEALEAALAAERAVRDAAGTAALPSPSRPAAPPAPPSPGAPREPRTPDGDLPAIW